jgi:hypothetical protein
MYVRKIEAYDTSCDIHHHTMSSSYCVEDYSQAIAVLEEFLYDEFKKYLVILDYRRGADILEYLSKNECSVRIVIDIDSLEDAITFTPLNGSLVTKSIYIRPQHDLDTQGIIDTCGAASLLMNY